MQLNNNADPAGQLQPSPPPTGSDQTWGRAMLDALADAREILAARLNAGVGRAR